MKPYTSHSQANNSMLLAALLEAALPLRNERQHGPFQPGNATWRRWRNHWSEGRSRCWPCILGLDSSRGYKPYFL